MVLNYIWIGFFLVALIVAIIKTFNGDLEIFSVIVNSTFTNAQTSFEIAIGLTGVLCLWLGIMKIGENGGAIQGLSKIVGPFFSKLFPEVPENHPARGSMLMNFSANMLGLDNAATPMGLKAMNELQELNPDKDKASNAQIMFLVLNTSGLTLIPITVMNYRSQYGSLNPSEVFLPILLATFFASLAGLIIVSIYQKINLFNKVVLAYLGGISLTIGLIIWYFSSLSPEDLQTQSSLFSNIILFGIISAFIILGLVKKINVYESFIDGAKDGFSIAIKIIPYLVAIIVSIGVFKASGAMDYIIEGLRWVFTLMIPEPSFIEGLPTAFMKPLSGSAARGMMLSTFDEFGVDSYIGKLTATLQGATDTTFYIIAVYFGSVGIKKTRYAIKAGLFADLVGIIAAIVISSFFFSSTSNDNKANQTHLTIVSEYINHWENNENTNAENLLDKNCALYDFSFDTISQNAQNTNDLLFKEKISILSIKDMENQIYVKLKHEFNTKTYKFTVEENKIKSIQLQGNFE